jgi:hypothetical protein
MENTNAGVGQVEKARRQSVLLSISLSANVVFAVIVAGLAIWGWDRDKMVAAAIEERDEAYQTSRDFQGRLINAKGMINEMADPFRQQPPTPDDDPDAPR